MTSATYGIVAALLLGTPTVASAQMVLRVRVADSTGASVPYAVIEANPGGRRIADSVGIATFELHATVSPIRLTVRRIGFAPASATAAPGSQQVTVVLASISRALNAIVVMDRRSSGLVARGFYDRIEQVRRGAYTGEFIMPEDLERLAPSTVSRALVESRFVRVGRVGQRRLAVLLGRGGCGYTILVDGTRIAGTLEEAATGATSIESRGTARGRADTGIEDIVNGLDIAAIEVYPSAATAPVEIQAKAMGGRGTCGIVAIWTVTGR